VWGDEKGSPSSSAAAPKVFSLVGKSVEEIRAMASEVSPNLTTVEERVGLNKIVQRKV